MERIYLVDFISQDEQAAGVGKSEDFFDIFIGGDLSGWVAGVDDTDGFGLDIRLAVSSRKE